MNSNQLYERYLELGQYIGWSDYDVQRVRAAALVVAPCIPRIVDDFYEEIDRHQATRVLITGGREQVRRLKTTLTQWLDELFAGRHDQQYVERRWRIGRRHVEIGLHLIYANAAFARVRGGLISALVEGWTGTDQVLIDTIRSLNRVLDMDLAIIQLAYQTEFVKRQDVIEALRDSEEHLRAIVNTCVDAIVSIREDGTIERFNPAAERMFGWTAAEAIGRNVNLLMPPPFREEHDSYIEGYLRTGEAKIIGVGREVVGMRRDGTTFPVELAVSRMEELGMFIGILRDVSERKRTEQRLLQSERLVAIGQMITGLAHESRNAFQRSQSALELLEMEVEDNDEAVELVQRIQRAQDHLHHLYEEVRDYAAPIKLTRETCDLASLWRDTWRDLELARAEKHVVLRDPGRDADLRCRVDRNAMEQVFRNILENAIDACPDPGEISIRGESTTLDGVPALRISIRDNGPGFERDARQRIFEPFFTTKTKGTGLGMAIAHRIVESHGGSIEVGSTPPDSGAELVITLPRG